MSARLLRVAILGGLFFLSAAVIGTITLGDGGATGASGTSEQAAVAAPVRPAAPTPSAARVTPRGMVMGTHTLDSAVTAVTGKVAGIFNGMDQEQVGSAVLSTLLIASLIPLGLLVSSRRSRDFARRNGGFRVAPSKVRYMAARGAGYSEIARRTGLSQDAIALLLRDPRTPTGAGRKIPPAAARVA